MRKYEDGRVEKMNLINRGCRYQEKIHQELNYGTENSYGFSKT